jgi:hypothetical protein
MNLSQLGFKGETFGNSSLFDPEPISDSAKTLSETFLFGLVH